MAKRSGRDGKWGLVAWWGAGIGTSQGGGCCCWRWWRWWWWSAGVEHILEMSPSTGALMGGCGLSDLCGQGCQSGPWGLCSLAVASGHQIMRCKVGSRCRYALHF